MKSTSSARCFVWAAKLVLLSLGVVSSTLAQVAPPTFSKVFSPDTIGPGSVTTLRFDIGNPTSAPVTDLAFVDTLPAGVTLATPTNAQTSCAGNLVATDGGTTIAFDSGSVAGFANCAITVNVTSSTPGTHMNVSGDLTSTAGNSGAASGDLTVTPDRPGFSKSFSPSTVSLGSRSTLTFTVDNTANIATAFNLNFIDQLTVGMLVASPANAATSCVGGVVVANPGGNTITLTEDISVIGGSSLAAKTSCQVNVDVIGNGAGALANVSGELTSDDGATEVSSGKASAILSVTANVLSLSKSFVDDPTPPGGAVTLEFTIRNFDRNFPATNIAFSDDLNATLVGLAATGLPASNVCGAGSILSGTTTLSFSGGNLAPEGTCTFSATLLVPAGAVTGVYPNATSPISGDIDASGVIGGAAMDSLFVANAPTLTKTFLSDPIGGGATVDVEFVITNTSPMAATDIAFSDNLSTFISGILVTTLPPNGFCGAGSTIFIQQIAGDDLLRVTSGDLAGLASCTFTVGLQLPVATPPGTHLNTTSPVTATIAGSTSTGNPATDTLTIVTPPILSKEFTDDPSLPGGLVTLEFTLNHDISAARDATNIAFSDDLNAALANLTAIGLPMNDVCGVGSLLSGTANLSFSGGTLSPGESCTFPVALNVDAAALPGIYTNTTSNVSATILGTSTLGNAAQDDLRILGLEVSKSFTNDPVAPGGTVNLAFTIDNTGAQDVTNIFFQDNLGAALAGLTAIGPLPGTPCGVGSSIVGTTTLTFSGGNLLAGNSCTFNVALQVPMGAAPGSYPNVTTATRADIGATPNVPLPPGTDTLEVLSDFLFLTKSFTDDPVAPGGTVTLDFTLSNLDGAQSATNIAFSDNLDAALTGLVASGLPAMNICGAGSQISGTSSLAFSGGSLPAGGTCTFSVILQVPAAAAVGMANNTTGQVTGTIAGLPVTGPPAVDTLQIATLPFSKAFANVVGAGQTVILSFTIDNLDGLNSVANLGFTDDLNAVLPGLTATGLPANNVCGAGSVLAGSSLLTLSGGSLAALGSCTFNVTLAVPVSASPGMYLNTTSDLFVSGISSGSPATATLTIVPPPTFAKAFVPASIRVGANSTLTFSIDNSASGAVASALNFTDNLPASLFVATPANASTTCTGGSLTAIAGSGVISYSGGSVMAGATCTIQVDITGTVGGAFVNTTSALTSSLGDSGAASDTLTVIDAVALTKTFLANPVRSGTNVDLQFTLSNPSASQSVTNIAFSDDLNTMLAGLSVATALPIADPCGSGSQLTASGTPASLLSFTGGSLAASASCTFAISLTVPVAAIAGTYTNTTSVITADAGGLPLTGPPGTANLDVVALTFSKAFTDDPVMPGDTVTLAFTLVNQSPTLAATNIAFSDDLGTVAPGLQASGLPLTNICGPGSQISGTSLLAFASGSLAAGQSCTFSVNVLVPATTSLGAYINVTSAVASDFGGLPVTTNPANTATDTLGVAPISVPTLHWWALTLLAVSLLLGGVLLRRTKLERGS